MVILNNNIKAFVDFLDAGIANLGLRAFGERPGLSCFLFHAIKEKPGTCPTLFPQEDLSIRALDHFIEAFLGFGYSFIGPEEIVAGRLDPNKKYGLLTFDDGYFNNTWATDVLEKHNIPAVFFITTRLILEQEKQWADIIHYQRSKRGSSSEAIRREIFQLVPKRIAYIRDYITGEFGRQSFVPKGDQDRPMTAEELKAFSQHRLVHIGNHSHSHEPLKFLNRAEVRKELLTSQKHLREITGKAPAAIAYPYGIYSSEVVKETRKMGFTLGVTTAKKRLALPLAADSLLTLQRLNPVARQDSFNFNTLRSPVQFKLSLQKALTSANRFF